MTYGGQRYWTLDAPEPLRDALRVLCGGADPPAYVRGYDYSNLTDNQHDELQSWVSVNLADGIFWSTAIGVIEAAEKLVAEAVCNANIPPNPAPALRSTPAKVKHTLRASGNGTMRPARRPR